MWRLQWSWRDAFPKLDAGAGLFRRIPGKASQAPAAVGPSREVKLDVC